MKMLAQFWLITIVFANVKSYEIQYSQRNVNWRHSVEKRQALTTKDTAQHDPITLPKNETVATNATLVKPNDVPKELAKESNVLPPTVSNSTTKSDANVEVKKNATETPKESGSLNTTNQVVPSAIQSDATTSKPVDTVNISPINSPGVVKRGLIVFGGFALLAVAYLIFYRRKGKNYESNNTHNNNDNNQFRYGVLQSEEGRDNLELSRIPLTMESDDDDEDDLEIFDLEQKKQSLSYVNLQATDEDIVFHNRKDESKNNLLLDIEEGPSDMINWSSTSNKSIL